jgi:hypothetical protein
VWTTYPSPDRDLHAPTTALWSSLLDAAQGNVSGMVASGEDEREARIDSSQVAAILCAVVFKFRSDWNWVVDGIDGLVDWLIDRLECENELFSIASTV